LTWWGGHLTRSTKFFDMTKVENFQGHDANEVARAVTGFLAIAGRKFIQLVAGPLDQNNCHVVYVVYTEENEN
jgi:hypothetical protein